MPRSAMRSSQLTRFINDVYCRCSVGLGRLKKQQRITARAGISRCRVSCSPSPLGSGARRCAIQICISNLPVCSQHPKWRQKDYLVPPYLG